MAKKKIIKTEPTAPEQVSPTPVESESQTLGQILQQARRRHNMKLATAAKKLKIKEIYLEALEQGHYYTFPALVYGAGFLRSYATFLGLDADTLVDRFHRETTDIHEEPLDMPRTQDPDIFPSVKAIVLSLGGLLLLYIAWTVFHILTYQPFPDIKMPQMEQVMPAPDVMTEAPVTADELTLQTVKEVAPQPMAQPIQQPAKPEPVVKSTPARKPITYGMNPPMRVSFVATRDNVSIEVRDIEEGTILLRTNLNQGDRYNPVEDPDGLVLKTENAGGLDVYVDGRKVRTLGKLGQAKAGIQMDAANLLKD